MAYVGLLNLCWISILENLVLNLQLAWLIKCSFSLILVWPPTHMPANFSSFPCLLDVQGNHSSLSHYVLGFFRQFRYHFYQSGKNCCLIPSLPPTPGPKWEEGINSWLAGGKIKVWVSKFIPPNWLHDTFSFHYHNSDCLYCITKHLKSTVMSLSIKKGYTESENKPKVLECKNNDK